MHTTNSLQVWKQRGNALSNWIESKMLYVVLSAMCVGFIISPLIQSWTSAITYLFAYITFIAALGCSPQQLKQALAKPVVFLLFLVLAHGIAPLIAYSAGGLVFGFDSPFVVGLVLFTIIPLGVSPIIWISIAGGKASYILPMVILDSILSPLTVPMLMSLFFQQQLSVDPVAMMKNLSIIILIPTLLGMMVNMITRGTIKQKVDFFTAPTSKIMFMVIIAINGAMLAPYILQLDLIALMLIPMSVVIIAFGYMMGYFASLWFKSRNITITLPFAVGMRNIMLGVVLIVAYYEPLAAVPVILTTLLQQPMAAMYLRIHRKLTAQRILSKNEVESGL